MKIEKTYSLDKSERIDKFIGDLEEYAITRSLAGKLVKLGEVLVNEKPCKASYKLSKGDKISINLPKEDDKSINPENIELDIVYEDQDILIVNKDKDMVVHPAPGHYSGTLVNALLYKYGKEGLSDLNGEDRPGIVHRIDMDTSGLLLVCKTNRAHEIFAEKFKIHDIERRYTAIVLGNVKDDEGTIDAAIGRNKRDRKKKAIDHEEGRRAVTHYKVIKRLGDYTLIECRLETGRTHQIRVHMASINHPVLGDPLYGAKNCPFNLKGQCLHAGVLGFTHPFKNEYMEFKSDYPKYFSHLLEVLEKRSRR